MHGMLFGMETELAFATRPREVGTASSGRALLGDLYRLASRRVASLPEEHGEGMFLANGARFYLDRGDHPEVCTPECQSPVDVVRWQLACEKILAELTAEIEKRHPETEVSLYRCNVDYSGSGKTWGCHESYQHRRTHVEMAPQLIPHLVSRLVYTGAGGFDNTREDLQFLISPRVPHLVREVGGDTPERGIYNTRDEPLSEGGFHRLHVICGESLCSELGNYLKLGTTALVVRLVDAGVCRGSDLALESPIGAMRAFALDPTGRARATLVDGRRLGALEIQAEYLEMVEAHLGAAFMPAWAAPLCQRWRRVLEQLASGPEALATSLDWAIKLALFRDRADRSGEGRRGLQRGSGISAELCEIDTRFGELSVRSLFHALDEAGVLTHRIPERGSVADAMLQPPAGARAEARGRAIRELHRERRRYRCRWDAIRDLREPRVLDLGDPFATEGRWTARSAHPGSVRPRAIPSPLRLRIDRGVRAYKDSDLARAAFELSRAAREAAASGDRGQEAEARFWCSAAHHDMGDLARAQSLLAPMLEDPAGIPLDFRVRASTRHALILIERPAPLAEIEQAIEGARSACRDAGLGIGASRLELLEARLVGARGRTPDAILSAEKALADAQTDPIGFSDEAHLRWLMVFLLRGGRYRRALERLDAWRARVEPGGLRSYAGVSVAIAESALALRLGRTAHARERAWSAFERSDPLRRHRCRVAAGVAFLESAAASGELEGVEAVLSELRTWRRVQLGELRYELRRAELLVRLARRPRRYTCALRVAQREARILDGRLGCERHARELEEWIRRLG